MKTQKQQLHVAVWILFAIIGTGLDMFWTPSLMNHASGNTRWTIMIVSSFVMLPYFVLCYRIGRYVKLYFIKKDLKERFNDFFE